METERVNYVTGEKEWKYVYDNGAGDDDRCEIVNKDGNCPHYYPHFWIRVWRWLFERDRLELK